MSSERLAESAMEFPRLARYLTSDIEIQERAESAGGLRFSASSELAVERPFGTEILAHDKGSVRMERIKARAVPLLFNHDDDDPVGMIDAGELGDARLLVEAHFFDTARAKEVAQMVRGGLRNVSLKYQIHGAREMAADVYRITDWEPLEVSIVSIPADHTVGIGRADEQQTKYPARLIRAISADAATTTEQTSMESNAPAAGTADVSVVVKNDGTEMERARIKAIHDLARAHRIDDKTRDEWIYTSALSPDDAARRVLDIIAERTAKNPQTEAKLDLSKKDLQAYSLRKAILAAADKTWHKSAGLELEASREIANRLGRQVGDYTFFVPFDVQQRAQQDVQRRDLTVATASAGGYLVETNNVGFVEMLRNRSVAFRMGVRRLSGLQGNVTIPKQTGTATAYWLATEATSITEGALTLGQISMQPKTAGAYTEISRQLLLQSSPDAEGLVTDDLSRTVATAVDLAVLNGAGSGGEPLGIINTPSIGSTTATSVDYSKVLDFQADVAAANVMPVAGGYVTTSAVAAILAAKSRFANTDTPLWDGNLWDGTMAGFRAMSSEQMPAGTMLFGDWSQVVVGEWGVLEVEVNPTANFPAGIIGVRAMYSVDVAVRYAGAFSYASSVTA